MILKYFKLAILGQQQGSVYIARSGGPGVPGGVPGGGQPVAINLSNNQTLNLSKAGNPGGASLSAAKITGIFSWRFEFQFGKYCYLALDLDHFSYFLLQI